MKKTVILKTLSYFVCILLIAAIATVTIGCNDKKSTDTSSVLSNTESAEVIEKGKGQNYFTVGFTTLDGKETVYKILTDKKTVGEALLELELISGEEGDYGLMVTTVGSVAADTSSEYWAFYVNGEYAMKGVDSTNIENGATYTLKIEKFK